MDIIKSGRLYGLSDKETGEMTQKIQFAEKGYEGTTDKDVLEVLICRHEHKVKNTGCKATNQILLHLKAAAEYM